PACCAQLPLAAEAPPETWFLRLGGLLPDRTRTREEVFRAERHQLLALELGELVAGHLREPERLRVQRLLEQRPREPCVAEALSALRRSEDPPNRLDCALAEAVLVLREELRRDREQLLGRVVRERDLAREARAQPRVRVEEAVHQPRVAGHDHDEAVAV